MWWRSLLIQILCFSREKVFLHEICFSWPIFLMTDRRFRKNIYLNSRVDVNVCTLTYWKWCVIWNICCVNRDHQFRVREISSMSRFRRKINDDHAVDQCTWIKYFWKLLYPERIARSQDFAHSKNNCIISHLDSCIIESARTRWWYITENVYYLNLHCVLSIWISSSR